VPKHDFGSYLDRTPRTTKNKEGKRDPGYTIQRIVTSGLLGMQDYANIENT
jgi:hypothetical protein